MLRLGSRGRHQVHSFAGGRQPASAGSARSAARSAMVPVVLAWVRALGVVFGASSCQWCRICWVVYPYVSGGLCPARVGTVPRRCIERHIRKGILNLVARFLWSDVFCHLGAASRFTLELCCARSMGASWAWSVAQRNVAHSGGSHKRYRHCRCLRFCVVFGMVRATTCGELPSKQSATEVCLGGSCFACALSLQVQSIVEGSLRATSAEVAMRNLFYIVIVCCFRHSLNRPVVMEVRARTACVAAAYGTCLEFAHTVAPGWLCRGAHAAHLDIRRGQTRDAPYECDGFLYVQAASVQDQCRCLGYSIEAAGMIVCATARLVWSHRDRIVRPASRRDCACCQAWGRGM